MLPGSRRIRRGHEFRAVMRSGNRAASRTVVVHLGTLPPGTGPARGHASSTPARASDDPARVGFIVGRSVGRAVVRNRVTRRLRHLVAGQLDNLAPGMGVVVRALPPAADATSEELGSDLERALRRCLNREGHAPVPSAAVSQ